MQRRKCGNPHRISKRRKRQIGSRRTREHLEAARLTLYETDLITGREDVLFTLSYEHYRGYTIYSTESGTCCIHGRNGGCLRIERKYACFPDSEQAKRLIEHFRADGRTAQESMSRYVSQDAYRCLNRRSWQQSSQK